MQNIFIELMPPWVESGLQPAFYDKESGSVLQQVARMYAKVNWLVRMFNKFSKDTSDYVNQFVDDTNAEIARFEHDTTETVNDYIARFVALKEFVDDYFENLDVQEEINNKLDDMTEQGTLQEIITAYIQANVAWTFDTVADMKLATNFVDGSFAETLGYTSKSDGGSALYKIRALTIDDVIDEMTIIALDDATLVAELVNRGDTINIESFGATENTDSTTALNTAISFASTHGVTIVFGAKTYKVNATITASKVHFRGCGNDTIITNYANTSSTLTVNGTNNTFEDMTISHSDDATYAAIEIGAQYNNFERVRFQSTGYGIKFNNAPSNGGLNKFTDCVIYRCQAGGVIIPANDETGYCNGNTFVACHFDRYYDEDNPVKTISSGTSAIFIGCWLQLKNLSGVELLTNLSLVRFIGCKIDSSSSSDVLIEFSGTSTPVCVDAAGSSIDGKYSYNGSQYNAKGLNGGFEITTNNGMVSKQFRGGDAHTLTDLGGSNLGGVKIGNSRIFWAANSSPDSTQTFLRGDVMIQSNPSSTSKLISVCTTAGAGSAAVWRVLGQDDLRSTTISGTTSSTGFLDSNNSDQGSLSTTGCKVVSAFVNHANRKVDVILAGSSLNRYAFYVRTADGNAPVEEAVNITVYYHV